MNICDLSGLYSPTGGGIRTYHLAKLAWFASQQHHRYLFVTPGARFSIDRPAPAVTVVTTYGPTVRGDYRLPIDLRRMAGVVRDFDPDLVETGDPWVTGPLALWMRKRRLIRAPVTSFFHAEPLCAYLQPWVERGLRSRRIRESLSVRGANLFYRMQRRYDATIASSERAELALRTRGVSRVLRIPFGVDDIFFRIGERRLNRTRRPGPIRMLYAGRLQQEKGFGVLVDALPALLRSADLTLTIAGAGPMAPRAAAFAHPRVRQAGYIEARGRMAALYAAHDVLLAPGRYETFGLAVLEGLASGLAVVGPDAGGAGELLRQIESPLLFVPGDSDDFARVAHRAAVEDLASHARAGLTVARRYGTASQAVTRQMETYCAFLSLSTT